MKECQNIEFKETWSDDYLKWICGFANAQGGKLYIGVDDSEKLGVSTKTIARNLAAMKNHVRFVGRGYSGHWETIDVEKN